MLGYVAYITLLFVILPWKFSEDNVYVHEIILFGAYYWYVQLIQHNPKLLSYLIAYVLCISLLTRSLALSTGQSSGLLLGKLLIGQRTGLTRIGWGQYIAWSWSMSKTQVWDLCVRLFLFSSDCVWPWTYLPSFSQSLTPSIHLYFPKVQTYGSSKSSIEIWYFFLFL